MWLGPKLRARYPWLATQLGFDNSNGNGVARPYRNRRSETEAVGRFYMQELRQDAGSGGWSDAYGVYHDRYEHDGERWRFAERSYQSLARTGRFEVFPFPEAFRGHVTHEA